MNITTRGKYGVKAVFELALRKGQGPVPLRIIAESQSLPEQYLEQLMGSLRKSGLVKSVRGARGGYMLARGPEHITVGQVLGVLEGSFLSEEDSGSARGRRPAGGRHPGGSSGSGGKDSGHNTAPAAGGGDESAGEATVDTVWNEIGRAVRKVVDSITFEDLRRAEMEKNRRDAHTYYI